MDKSNDVSVGLYRDARQQLIKGFASDREDRNLLTFDQAVEYVNHRHVGADHLGRNEARHRIDRWPADVHLVFARQAGALIHRLAVATEHAAEDVR